MYVDSSVSCHFRYIFFGKKSILIFAYLMYKFFFFKKKKLGKEISHSVERKIFKPARYFWSVLHKISSDESMTIGSICTPLFCTFLANLCNSNSSVLWSKAQYNLHPTIIIIKFIRLALLYFNSLIRSSYPPVLGSAWAVFARRWTVKNALWRFYGTKKHCRDWSKPLLFDWMMEIASNIILVYILYIKIFNAKDPNQLWSPLLLLGMALSH